MKIRKRRFYFFILLFAASSLLFQLLSEAFAAAGADARRKIKVQYSGPRAGDGPRATYGTRREDNIWQGNRTEGQPVRSKGMAIP